MVRLVLIHQLVLSLLAGPMLCCCSAARLGHDLGTTSRAGEPGRKSCCGQHQKPAGGDRQGPGHEKPGDPGPCPCKDGPAQTLAVPEVAAGPADSQASHPTGVAAFDLPASSDALSAAAVRPPARPDVLSSAVTTADLLFAHHNLRC